MDLSIPWLENRTDGNTKIRIHVKTFKILSHFLVVLKDQQAYASVNSIACIAVKTRTLENRTDANTYYYYL